jgi:hypothetical protein
MHLFLECIRTTTSLGFQWKVELGKERSAAMAVGKEAVGLRELHLPFWNRKTKEERNRAKGEGCQEWAAKGRVTVGELFLVVVMVMGKLAECPDSVYTKVIPTPLRSDQQ